MSTSDIYKSLFELSIDMLCVASVEGQFQIVNPAMCLGLGYSEEELLSRPFIYFVHPDDVDDTISAINMLKNGHKLTNFTNRYRHSNGSYRSLVWSSQVDQETGKIFAAARDQTEHLRTKQKADEIERILYAETIIAQTDKEGLITYVNKKFCDISGYSAEELIGRSHKLINSKKHPKEFFQNLWQTIKSGKRWTGLIENRKKNGEHYFVQSIISPLFNLEGEIESYLAIRFDVTDAILAKKEQERTLEILNETGSIAKVGGWELEVATGELSWTDETFQILEVEKKQGQKPILPEGLDLFVDEHKPIIESAVSRAISHGEPYSLELLAKTAKGNILWVYTNGKANYENGKVVTLSGTIQDIDARKKAELKYEQEHLKANHNAKLASLGQLAAGVAHEINNPLAIIQSSSELIPKFLDNPKKLRSKLDSIETSCARISHIVGGLRRFSRTSSGTKFERKSLAAILNEAQHLTEIQANRHNISMTLQQSTDGFIDCNELEIEQVIINLINNAIFAIKDKEEKWVNLNLSETGESVILSITDSGTGIPKSVKEKLFDPFFTTKPTGEGTGLGLAITKGILDEHKASITVDEASKNTKFILIFPKERGSAA